MEEQLEDPEGAEEILVKRDAERGVGPASHIGGDTPREALEHLTVGEFVDGLPDDLDSTVYLRGQWWNVRKVHLPGDDG